MAEKGDEEEDAAAQSTISSWWGSFYDSAKQKLAETNEFIVRDIQEFTQTVKTDTSKLVADAATSMKDQLNIKVNLDEASNATKLVTNSLTDFLGKVVHHVTPITPEDNENEDSTMFLGTSSGVKVMSPAEARLFNLQISPATYCNEPDNAIEFEMWLESFVLDEKKEDLSLLMLDCKEVRSLYTKLVPEAVSHVDFWTRYFYKKHQLEKAEERRAMLVERAQNEETELGWGDEDDYDVIDYPLPNQPATSTKSEVKDESLEKDEAELVKPEEPQDITNVISKTDSDKMTSNTNKSVACPEEPVMTSPDSDSQSKHTNNVSSCDSQVGGDGVVSSVVEDKKIILEGQDETDNNKDKILPNLESKPASVDAKTVDKLPDSSGVTKNESKKAQESVLNKVVESSSGDSSDWEKEFDLDMTEEEINQALQQEDQVDDIEGWEEWE